MFNTKCEYRLKTKIRSNYNINGYIDSEIDSLSTMVKAKRSNNYNIDIYR